MRFTTGNLLEADVQALVNTVNTVGVMGKGIALMFKEQFPEASEAYELACSEKRVRLGEVFAVETEDLYGPDWIVHFPTKGHWRYPSKMTWISDGLDSLASFIEEKQIQSIAIPPLGAGNGKLDWGDVRSEIEARLGHLSDVDILVFEPTKKYQNVAKREGVEKLTPARALLAEMVRRYSILGIECTFLEVHKLAYFINELIKRSGVSDPLKLEFKADKFGPYAPDLRFLLNSLDGSYLESDKRINDSGPFDSVRFNDSKRDFVGAYFSTDEAREYKGVLDQAAELIQGFESPLGMELLATVDWLIRYGNSEPTVDGLLARIKTWPGGKEAAARKSRIFEERFVKLALERVVSLDPITNSP